VCYLQKNNNSQQHQHLNLAARTCNHRMSRMSLVHELERASSNRPASQTDTSDITRMESSSRYIEHHPTSIHKCRLLVLCDEGCAESRLQHNKAEDRQAHNGLELHNLDRWNRQTASPYCKCNKNTSTHSISGLADNIHMAFHSKVHIRKRPKKHRRFAIRKRTSNNHTPCPYSAPSLKLKNEIPTLS